MDVSCSIPSLLDLLVDGLQLFLQHNGQGLHVRLSAGGQQLGAEARLPVVVVVVVGAAHVQARLEPAPQQSPALPVRILQTRGIVIMEMVKRRRVTSAQADVGVSPWLNPLGRSSNGHGDCA